MGQYTRTVKPIDVGQYGTKVIGIAGSSGTINNGTSNPSSGTVGELFFNTTDDKLYVWNGSAWVDVT
jgi:hypothetical protein